MSLTTAAQVQFGTDSNITHSLYTGTGKKDVIRTVWIGKLTAAEKLDKLCGEPTATAIQVELGAAEEYAE